ncbi:hypothetical protein CRG98_046575 [Punica granatum]|uniref:Retrotransposon Copia-like N-terminal domain-containing protein n=1 Tax=Punica granatum TaxID=22663 RepID=A0A2I0HN85_PUNGR|nr:hypothetical protein CRG98_046575 [Punica granatum]
MTRNNGVNGGGQQSTPSVYLLNQSDGPRIVLPSCLLNGMTYITWTRAMEMALTAKGKLAFIEGVVPKPSEGDPLPEKWEACNATVAAWIFQLAGEGPSGQCCPCYRGQGDAGRLEGKLSIHA